MIRAQWRHDDTGRSTRQFHLNVRRFALNRTGRGGRRQNSIRADHVRRAKGLSTFGLLDYWGWPRRRLPSPRTERMRENIPVTPSA